MSPTLKKLARWAAVNVPIMGLAIYGLVTHADWAHNILIAVVWLLLIVSILTTLMFFAGVGLCTQKPEAVIELTDKLEDVPLLVDTKWFRALDVAYDTAMFLILAAAGWYVLAIVYATHVPFNLMTAASVRKLKDLRWQRIMAAIQNPNPSLN